MIHIYIFADSHKHFTPALDEYRKRLGKLVHIHELKPVKKGTSEEIIRAETQILTDKLKKERGYKIVLSPEGNVLSTEALVQKIQELKNAGSDIIFAIGGADGLDYDALRSSVDMELSLGKMTLPHSLAFTLLLEQLYRVSQIEKGTGYHK